MKQSLATLVALGLVFSAMSVLGGSYSIPAKFDTPTLIRQADGTERVEMKGLLNTMDAGLPSLPVKTYRIALPAGAVATGATFTPTRTVTLSGAPSLARSQIPMCAQVTRQWQKTMAPDFSGPQYPADRLRVDLQYLHGMPVMVLTVFPVVFSRAARQLEVALEGSIRVGWSVPNPVSVSLRKSEQADLIASVDNPETLPSIRTREPAWGDYDYLVISNDELANYQGDWDLKRLVAALASRNLKAQIATVKAIEAASTGNDLVEKIRNYIRDEHQRSGLRYVLLVGDGDKNGAGAIIPARKLWSKVRAYLNGNWYTVEENIPADLYYACLDGTFNGNGNDKWGEPSDGANGGDVDLLPEVTVGRAPIETVSELANFVRKTIQYNVTPLPHKILLMGESLFPEMNLYGDEYMDQLVGKCTDHNFETTGYPSDWEFTKLYDRAKEWTGEEALGAINSGNFAMVNHLGHSNQTYNMKLYSNWNTLQFTNERPIFYYTQGCFPGDFTYHDSFIEKMIRHSNAAAGAIANTTYGLAPEDPNPETTKTPGASQMLHRQFIHGIFTKGIREMGRSYAESKQVFLGLTTSQEIRWVFWATNYFGDPSLEAKF